MSTVDRGIAVKNVAALRYASTEDRSIHVKNVADQRCANTSCRKGSVKNVADQRCANTAFRKDSAKYARLCTVVFVTLQHRKVISRDTRDPRNINRI